LDTDPDATGRGLTEEGEERESEMDITIENLEACLMLAAVVAILARRLRLPYTVGLLLAGVAVAFSPWQPAIQVTKSLIFTLFLPPLVFEAAFALCWKDLRQELPPTVAMATVGVVASCAVIFGGLYGLLGWDWRAALMFSTLISATDPVSVIAMLREGGVSGRFRLVIETESLFNDGTAAALFAVALAAVTVGITPGAAVGTFFAISLGGIACGLAVGALSLFVMGRTEDHLVEITCTVLAAYGAFMLAEHFGCSGVLATLAAGLLVGNVGPLRALTERGRIDAESFWEFAAFVVNSLVFLLMGTRLAQTNYVPILAPAGVAIALMLLGRAVAVYGVMAPFSRTSHRLEMPSQHLLVWGGMRGALALALALGLPDSLPQRSTVVGVTFAVVAFSTVVQGMTMKPMLARLLRPRPVE
jgi:CPA1 family monovalent cation:H+ antiporter